MSLKFTPRPSEIASMEALETDIVSASQEAFLIYDEMVQKGLESKEMEQIMTDVAFVRDTVKRCGVRTYFYTFDKNNTFAAAFGCQPYQPGMGLSFTKALSAEYVSAAEEGLKEYWHKFIEAIKTIWTKFVTWVKTTFTFRERYLKKIKENLEKFDKLDTEAQAEVMVRQDADTIVNILKEIHKQYKTSSDLNNALTKTTKDSFKSSCSALIDLFEACGEKLEVDENLYFSVSSGDRSVDDQYPVKKDKISSRGWTTDSAKNFAKTLLDIESMAEFKRICSNTEDVMKKGYDEMIAAEKKASADYEGDSAKTSEDLITSMIRSRGSMIRMLSKAIAMENRMMVRACRTAIELLSAQKKEEK